jgi:hypothetical protein
MWRPALTPFPQTAEHLTLASLGKSPVAPSTSPRPLPGAGALQTGPALIAQPAGSVAVDPGKPGKGDRGKSQFSEDQDVPALFRAQLKDCALVSLVNARAWSAH